MRAGQGSSTHELGAIQVLEFYRRLVLHPRRGPGARHRHEQLVALKGVEACGDVLGALPLGAVVSSVPCPCRRLV